MANDRPLWRQGFDTVDQAVAPRLTDLVQSEQFAVAAGIVTRLQRGVQRRTERTTRRMLHLVNLPAGSDVTRLLHEIGTLQAQVRDLSRKLEQAESRGGGVDGGAARTDRPARSRPAGR
jgi:hypothetical protein